MKIKILADKYALELKYRVDTGIEAMKNDDTSHYLLCRVLGVTNEEGNFIDLYQNIGRFYINMRELFWKKQHVCV